MALLDFFNDRDGKREVAHGSDGRLNVSSRSDARVYYNSRDKSEAYTAVFDDANADALDLIFYLKNTNTNGKSLVIHELVVHNESASATFEVVEITGAPSDGTAVTPTCLNLATPKAAAVTCLATTDSSGGTPMTATAGATIYTTGTSGAFAGIEIHPEDALRLGQDQAIGITLKVVGTADTRCYGTVSFYFE